MVALLLGVVGMVIMFELEGGGLVEVVVVGACPKTFEACRLHPKRPLSCSPKFFLSPKCSA